MKQNHAINYRIEKTIKINLYFIGLLKTLDHCRFFATAIIIGLKVSHSLHLFII